MYGSFNKFNQLMHIKPITATVFINNNNNIWAWKQLGDNANSAVGGNVLAYAFDYSNNCVYMGGSFTKVNGSISANNIAMWDISYQTWRQLGNSAYNGTTGGGVSALALDSSNKLLYAGGTLTGVIDTVNTVGLTANRIVAWDISNQVWRQLGNTTYNGFINGSVSALALDSSNMLLYAGGSFTGVKDISNTTTLQTIRVAAWDISYQTWRVLGGNPNFNGAGNTVSAMVLNNTNTSLYIAGLFNMVNDNSNTTIGLSVNYIACWDIKRNFWSVLGNNTNNGLSVSSTIFGLDINPKNNQLYVAGSFTNVYDMSNNPSFTKYIAKYNSDSNTINNISSNGSAYVNNIVYAVASDISNNNIYVGGTFTMVYDSSNTNGIAANRIAIWDVSYQVWRQLGNTTYNGVNGNVQSLVFDASNSMIYVGGAFTSVQDTSNTALLSANRIARWDISKKVWRQLGNTTYNGCNNTVLSLAIDLSTANVYVGGQFSSVLDISNTTNLTANRIARWDIQNQVWRQLGNTANTAYNGTITGNVTTIVIDDSNSQVYVGGTFTSVQDNSNTVALTVNRIARWDIPNQVWRQLGNTTYNGCNNNVNTMIIDTSNSQLYVGGNFIGVQDTTNTSALTVNRIARWDIPNKIWKPVGTGVNSFVFTLALDSSNSQLYVGGNFFYAQDNYLNTVGLTTNYVAKWDIPNQVWRQLGTNNANGVGGAPVATMYSMAFLNNNLFLGGTLTTINTISTSAKNIASWDISNNCWRQLGNYSSNGVTTIATPNTSGLNCIDLDISNQMLYVGGWYTLVQDSYYNVGITVGNIAGWDISNNRWYKIGIGNYNGFDGIVRSLAVDSSNRKLYAGGATFTKVQDASNIIALNVNSIAVASI